MRVYLDNNSTIFVDEDVKKIYYDATKYFGNINVIYDLWIEARKKLNEAYDIIYLGISASDDVFTTERNNIVIKF